MNVGKRNQIVVVNNINKKAKEKKMKVSKIILASILGAVVLNCANADDYDGPRNRCKSKSDKIWVERTKACIPENPCKDSNFEKYCNRDFKNLDTGLVGYKILIDVYTKTHGISCEPENTESKIFGQDYVLCQGQDVLVFEFDDIDDALFNNEEHAPFQFSWEEMCRALGKTSLQKDMEYGSYYECQGITEDDCDIITKSVNKYYNGGIPKFENGEIKNPSMRYNCSIKD